VYRPREGTQHSRVFQCPRLSSCGLRRRRRNQQVPSLPPSRSGQLYSQCVAQRSGIGRRIAIRLQTWYYSVTDRSSSSFGRRSPPRWAKRKRCLQPSVDAYVQQLHQRRITDVAVGFFFMNGKRRRRRGRRTRRPAETCTQPNQPCHVYDYK
jgi:hypothetical protein